MNTRNHNVINQYMNWEEEFDYGYFYDTEHNEYIHNKDILKNKKPKATVSKLTNQVKETNSILPYIAVIVLSFTFTIYMYGNDML